MDASPFRMLDAHSSIRLVLDALDEDDCLCAALTCRAFRDTVNSRFALLPAGHRYASRRLVTSDAGVGASRSRLEWVRALGAGAPRWVQSWPLQHEAQQQSRPALLSEALAQLTDPQLDHTASQLVPAEPFAAALSWMWADGVRWNRWGEEACLQAAAATKTGRLDGHEPRIACDTPAESQLATRMLGQPLQLRRYQIDGVKWLLSLHFNGVNGMLSDAMGLGKTPQTVVLLAHLYAHAENHGPHLIVVPLSTMPGWRHEFERWAPELNVVLYKGSRKHRDGLFASHIAPLRTNVVVTTKEYLHEDKWIATCEWQYVVIDHPQWLFNKKPASTRLGNNWPASGWLRHKTLLLLTGGCFDDSPFPSSASVESWICLAQVLIPRLADPEMFQSFYGHEPNVSHMNDTTSCSELRTRLRRSMRPFMMRRFIADDQFAVDTSNGVAVAYDRIWRNIITDDRVSA